MGEVVASGAGVAEHSLIVTSHCSAGHAALLDAAALLADAGSVVEEVARNTGGAAHSACRQTDQRAGGAEREDSLGTVGLTAVVSQVEQCA